MSSLWNKTLFYLGLVDEEEQGAGTIDSPVGEVRQVEPGSAGTPFPPGQATTDNARTSTIAKPGSGVAGRRIEPPAATRQRMSDDRVYAEAGVYIHPNAGSTADIARRRMEPESHIIVARNFSDAQTLADSIRGGRGVVLDLRNTEPEMVRRIVDFASGLTYALDGKMAKTSKGVILITPSGVTLGTQERERLEKLGLFDSES
ncbi:MAG: cell division protein SepF [Acidimicrobiia bacterium]